jgi:hypothetical protein
VIAIDDFQSQIVQYQISERMEIVDNVTKLAIDEDIVYIMVV